MTINHQSAREESEEELLVLLMEIGQKQKAVDRVLLKVLRGEIPESVLEFTLDGLLIVIREIERALHLRFGN